MDRLYPLLQLVDSAFPSGAFAHSGGLEGFLSVGAKPTLDELGELLESVWRQQLLPADGVLGLAVHRAFRADDLERVYQLDGQILALKLGREWRDASLRTGHSFLEEARRLIQHDALEGFTAAVSSATTPGNYVAAFMSVCAALDVEEQASLLAWGYQSIAQLVAALLRLGMIGHRTATLLITRLRSPIEAGVKQVASANEAMVSSFAPSLEIASMAHERQYSRLFQS